jgi:DUF971 family protein
MSVRPTKLERAEPRRIRITWSDGQVREYSYGLLREKCPCATCREKRSAPPPSALALPVLSAAEAKPLEIESMKPIGNYAYSIGFSDGHATGIFSFDLLLEIGDVVESAGS